MAVYKFPSDSDDKKEQEEVHNPEFVYVDEPHQEGFSQGGEYFEAFSGLPEFRVPFFLRICAFLFSLLCFVIGGGFFFVFGVNSFMAILFGYRLEKLNALATRSWKQTHRMFVMGLSFFIGTFSPPLGIGFFLMYQLIHGEEMSKEVLDRLKRGSY